MYPVVKNRLEDRGYVGGRGGRIKYDVEKVKPDVQWRIDGNRSRETESLNGRKEKARTCFTNFVIRIL